LRPSGTLDFCFPAAGFNALHYSSTYSDPKPVLLSGHLLTSYKKVMKIHTIIRPMRDERLKELLNSEERIALKVKTTEKKHVKYRFYNSIGVTPGKQWKQSQKNKCCHLIA